MFDPNANEVKDLEWTITVQHGDNKMTMHSIAELMNFMLFPYLVRMRLRRKEQAEHHSIGDAAYSLMRAVRSFTGVGLKELHPFIMGEQRLPEPPIG